MAKTTRKGNKNTRSRQRSGARRSNGARRGSRPAVQRKPSGEQREEESTASTQRSTADKPPKVHQTGEFTLLDSGNMQKLEQWGNYTLVRPAAQAIWSPRLPEAQWKQADAVYQRNSSGSGDWQWNNNIDRRFNILFSNLSFEVKLTDFGHTGVFAEQAANWDWLRDLIRTRMQRTNQANLHVLNLFAYTGGSTLAASQAGAHVVHVDAAKGVVDWARDNAAICHLDQRPIRWLVDDALKFLQREIRRNNRYQGIILDPPTFGRGPKGEVFKIENDLAELLDCCRQLLAHNALFLLYSCHTPGFTPLVMRNQLQEVIGDRPGTIEHGEMTIPDAQDRPLPSGTFARWSAPE